MRIIIVSGRSGSGKSISLHVLEDLGYYCIDNLPAGLIPKLVEHVRDQYERVAIGIDARNLPEDIDQFHQILDHFKSKGLHCELIYIDADDGTLIKRFSETRRKHPLTSKDISLKEAVKLEKERLEPIAHLADLRIDTTNSTMHQLRETISQRVQKHGKQLSLLFESFGFKFGLPLNCDYIFDVRCLPNPYWHAELRPQTGLDTDVEKFLGESIEAQQMLKDLKRFLQDWIPRFETSNRSYMTIGIGCTGGQHRSVFIAKQLFEYFQNESLHVQM